MAKKSKKNLVYPTLSQGSTKIQNFKHEELPSDENNELIDNEKIILDFSSNIKTLRNNLNLKKNKSPVVEFEDKDISNWGSNSKNYYQYNSIESNFLNEEKNEDFSNLVNEAEHIDKVEQFMYIKKDDFSTNLIKSLGEISKYKSINNQNDNSITNLEQEKCSKDSNNNFEVMSELINSKNPEFLPLLITLNQNLNKISNDLNSFLNYFHENDSFKNMEFSLLNSKNKILLGYSIYICFYLFLKCNGVKIEGHPIVHRLLEFQLLFKKLKPIEQKLQGYINSASKQHKSQTIKAPHPEMLDDVFADQNKIFDEINSNPDIYKPPKLLPVDSNHITPQNEKELKDTQRFKNRFSRSEYVQEIRKELNEEPEELITTNEYLNQNNDLNKFSYLSSNSKNNENSNTNLFEESKMMSTDGLHYSNSSLSELVGFVDSILTKKENKSKLSQIKNKDSSKLSEKASSFTSQINTAYQAQIDATQSIKKQKEGINVKNRTLLKNLNSMNIDHNSNNEFFSTSTLQNDTQIENPDFIELKKIVETKKNFQKNLFKEKSQNHVPILPDKLKKNEHRATNNIIDENKGLIKKRKSIDGNSRVKYRMKHLNQMKKFKSTHPVIRSEDKIYSGELTGIKTKIAKSITLT